METTYNWVITQMVSKPQEANLNDVVETIHWRRQAVAVEGESTHIAETYGAMGCASPSETDFTAYADLTFEQVCKWLEDGNDVAAIDAGLDEKIQAIINPPSVTYPLPWLPTPNAL